MRAIAEDSTDLTTTNTGRLDGEHTTAIQEEESSQDHSKFQLSKGESSWFAVGEGNWLTPLFLCV